MEPTYRLYYFPQHLYGEHPREKNVLWRNPTRKLFLDAVTRVTPEVAERLLTDVGPLYLKSEALRQYTLLNLDLFEPGDIFEIRGNFEALESAITDWAARANLAPNDWYAGRSWFHRCGLYTLAIHAGYLEPPVDGPISVKLPYNAAGSLTSESDGSMTYKFNGFDPYSKDFGRYYSANMKAFRTALGAYVKQMKKEYYGLTLKESSSGKAPLHWEWLALHQVRGWNYQEIADWYGAERGKPIEPWHVGDTIRKNRIAIGLNERTKPGRPPNG